MQIRAIITLLAIACLIFGNAMPALCMDDPDPAQIAKWRTDLKDTKIEVRTAAALDLAKLLQDDPQVMNALRDALSTDDGTDAADALGPLLAKYPKYLSLLFASLKHQDPNVRQNAIRAYGKARQSTAPVVDALIAVTHDPQEDVRKEVYTTLGELGTSDKRVVSTLLAALTKETEDCQLVAATTLLPIAVADADVRKQLLETARKGDAKVHIAFCKSIEDDTPSLPDAWPVMIGFWDDTDLEAQKQTATSLGWIMQREASALDMVITAARAARGGARIVALQTLAQLSVVRPDIVEILHQALKDSDPEVARNSVVALRHLYRNSPLFQPLIPDALHHKLPEARAWGLSTLRDSGALESPHFGDDLLAALKDESPLVREEAVQLATATYRRFPAIREGILALVHDDSAPLRSRVLSWLSNLEEQEDAFQTFYIEALNDPEASIRQAATSILAGRGKPTPETMAGLRKVIQDKEETVRRTAILTTGAIGTHDPKTVALLIAATHDPRLGTDAAMALVRIAATGPDVVVALLPMVNQEPFPAVPYLPNNWGRWKNNLGISVSFAEYVASIAPADTAMLTAFRGALRTSSGTLLAALISAYGKLEIHDASAIQDMLTLLNGVGTRRDIGGSIAQMAERVAAHANKVTDIHLLRLIQVLQEASIKLAPLSEQIVVSSELRVDGPRPPTIESRLRGAITLLEQEKKRRLGKK